MTILASIAWWLSTAALAGLAQTAPIPLPLAVTGATPEADGQTVMITGAHFGPSPFVTLDLVPLPLRAIGDTQIAAAAPVAAMPPGEYLLTVSRGGGPLDTSSFPLILGGGKPKRGASLPATATPLPSGGNWSPAGTDRAVQVGDRIITVAEIDREWQRIDPAGYIDVNRQTYEMRRQVADSMVSDELLAQEAAARHLSSDALLAEEIPKRIIRAPDSAVASLYEDSAAARGRHPGANAAVAARVARADHRTRAGEDELPRGTDEALDAHRAIARRAAGDGGAVGAGCGAGTGHGAD